jgi:hypothetical protein
MSDDGGSGGSAGPAGLTPAAPSPVFTDLGIDMLDTVIVETEAYRLVESLEGE